MAYLIERLKTTLAKQGLAQRSGGAREWLRSKIKNLAANPRTLMADRNRLRNQALIGSMYFFFYDPKLKDTLPFYDRFPLVLPIERYNDGFLGLNLHYIHPKQRIILLDKLSAFANNDRYDETTRLRLSYAVIKAASQVYEATPCVKRYLFGHIQSRFLQISADEWDIAALLPSESFAKATSSKVYADSRKKF